MSSRVWSVQSHRSIHVQYRTLRAATACREFKRKPTTDSASRMWAQSIVRSQTTIYAIWWYSLAWAFDWKLQGGFTELHHFKHSHSSAACSPTHPPSWGLLFTTCLLACLRHKLLCSLLCPSTLRSRTLGYFTRHAIYCWSSNIKKIPLLHYFWWCV